MITDDIANVMRELNVPTSARDIAVLASLPYKVCVDALGRMLDCGIVVRFGRKYSSEWALAGTEAGQAALGLGRLEAVWHAGRPPTPTGGGRSAPPAAG